MKITKFHALPLPSSPIWPQALSSALTTPRPHPIAPNGAKVPSSNLLVLSVRKVHQVYQVHQVHRRPPSSAQISI